MKEAAEFPSYIGIFCQSLAIFTKKSAYLSENSLKMACCMFCDRAHRCKKIVGFSGNKPSQSTILTQSFALSSSLESRPTRPTHDHDPLWLRTCTGLTMVTLDQEKVYLERYLNWTIRFLC